MQRETLYKELTDTLSWEPDKVISGSFAFLMDYDDEQYALDNTWIPLANTANRDELCESYSEEQIRMMATAILDNRKSKLSFQDKLINIALIESYKKTMRPRKERSDNKEYLAKQMLLNKEKIIQNLLLHQSILYNPIAISKWEVTHCTSILKFDLGFIDRHKFITRKYIWNSRNTDWCIINVQMLNEIGHPHIDRKDILDVDLRHYTLVMRLLIQDNNFNWLK